MAWRGRQAAEVANLRAKLRQPGKMPQATGPSRQRWRAIVASVNLAAFIETVKQRLAAAGLVS